jgi:CheY-like chemotaxis protein
VQAGPGGDRAPQALTSNLLRPHGARSPRRKAVGREFALISTQNPKTPELHWSIQMLMDTTELRSILYVDDEPDIRQIVQLALGLTAGLTVHTGESGEQALALARELQPDLLLLDVMMPGLDGPGTLQRLRADSAIAHIPVIFMTAKAMAREIALFRKMGAVGVIAKPFDPMQLGKQVLSLWKDHAAELLTHG